MLKRICMRIVWGYWLLVISFVQAEQRPASGEIVHIKAALANLHNDAHYEMVVAFIKEYQGDVVAQNHIIFLLDAMDREVQAIEKNVLLGGGLFLSGMLFLRKFTKTVGLVLVISGISVATPWNVFAKFSDFRLRAERLGKLRELCYQNC